MGLLSSTSDFFALDIGTTAVRLVQLKGGGATRSLVRYGSVPIEKGVSQSDSPGHKTALLNAIQELMAQTGVSTKNVAVGIPSSKMFATVIDFANLPEKELPGAIMYQADQFIPTNVDDSKIDWQVIGPSPTDSSKVEILLASVTKSYAESRLNTLESIGLNVIAMEPDPFALARSLTPYNDEGATLILDMGANATDLVVTTGGAVRLARSIPTGGNTLVKAAEQNLSVDEKQAMQFVYKFGLIQDKLEGQVYKALTNTVDTLVTEVDKSIKFFTARYNKQPINKIIVTGRASVLPEFPVYLVNKTNVAVEIGNAWLNTSYPQANHNDLMSVANQYAVAAGLAERVEV